MKSTKVNPSEEIIPIGPLNIRFLLKGEDTNGSVSVGTGIPVGTEVGV